MKLWASKQPSGVMLTALQPTRAKVRGTSHYDWYMQPGDPIGVRHLCEAGFEALTGVRLPEGGQVRIELTAQVLGD